MPAELKDELEDQEELHIDDDDHADDDGAGDTVGDEDRGDDFVDPELQDNEDVRGDAGEADQQGDKDASGDPGEGGDTGDGKIPASRLGEVSRAKSAATAIADGLVDGSIDPSIVRDFGGAAAVAKAVANREITIEDLKAGVTPFKQQEDTGGAQGQTEQAAWDLDAKYVEYQELVDAGETKEAATLLRQINKEERARERAEEQQQQAQRDVTSFVKQLVTEFPVLNDTKSAEHESVMVWANHFQLTQRLGRVEALQKAIEKVGLIKAGDVDGGSQDQKGGETPQQRVIRQRKEAAIRKAADAQNRQPPPMDLGASPKGPAKINVADLDEDSFRNMSEVEKRRERGDFL